MQQDKYNELYVDVIEVSGRNPRLTFDDDNFNVLVESIKAEGILEPLLVNVVHSTFVLIAGERRLRAAKQLKMEKVPCCLLYGEDDDSVDRKQIVENEVRVNLTVLEKGLAIKRYLKKHTEATQKEVAKLFFIDKTALSKAIKVIELPEKVWVYIQQHRLSDGNAEALLPLLGKVTEDKIVEIATVAQTLTTKAVREMVKDTLSTSKSLSEKVDSASKGLITRYGEKADIKRSGKGYVITLRVAENELDDTLTLMGAVIDDESAEDLSEKTVADSLNDVVEEQVEEQGEEQDNEQYNAEDYYTLGAVLFTHSKTDAVLSINETLAFLKAQRAGKIAFKGVCSRSKDSEQLEFKHDNGKRYKVSIPKKFTKMSFAEVFDAIYESGMYDKSKGVLSKETGAVKEVVEELSIEEKTNEAIKQSTYDTISNTGATIANISMTDAVDETITLLGVAPAVTTFDKMFMGATEYIAPESEVKDLAEEFSEVLDGYGYDEDIAIPDMDISGIEKYNEDTEEDTSVEIKTPSLDEDRKVQEQAGIKDKRPMLFNFPYPVTNFPCEDSYSYTDERKLIFSARNLTKETDLSEVAIRELIHAIHTGKAKLLRKHISPDGKKIKIFNYKDMIEVMHDPSIYGWVMVIKFVK